LPEKKFVPKRGQKNVLNPHLGQLRHIGNLKLKEVSSFAGDYFERWKKGIKFENLERKFELTKEQAQRILKRGVNANYFFTFGRTNPQVYYPTSRKAEVTQYLYKNVLNDTTGTGTDNDRKEPSKNGVFLPLENLNGQKADSLLEALMLTYTSPRYFHNIHLQFPIHRQYYCDIDAPIQNRTKAKKLEHRIDGNVVTFLYYRTGTVAVTIPCSKNPFKIETTEDEYAIHTYLGQIRGKSLDHLSDSRGCIIPNIAQWILTECDVNIDVEVTEGMQISFPALQIYPNVYVMQIQEKISCKSFFDVLRIYIKSIEDKAFLRFEGLMSSCSPVLQVLQNLRYPRAISQNQN